MSFKWGKTIQPQPNKNLRSAALHYDQNLTKYVRLLFQDYYHTNNINKVFTEIKSFLENNGNLHEVTTFYTAENNKLEQAAKDWDRKNDTHTISLFYKLMKTKKTNACNARSGKMKR